MSKTDQMLGALAAIALVVTIAGCADMKDQAKLEPYEDSAFFRDGRASRVLVEGTVARGHLRDDDRIFRGLEADGSFVSRVPVTVDSATLARGRERYDIFCAPCHGGLGDGTGMIVQRGYKQPSSYHTDRLRQIEDGYIYDVISNGFGKMSSYASQVRPMDRWAIVAYVRAIQLSNMGSPAELPREARAALDHGDAYDPHAEDETHGGDDHESAH